MVLRRVLVSGPITALASASPRRKVTIFGRRTSGPGGGRKEGPRGAKGVRKPLALRKRRTINSSLRVVPLTLLSPGQGQPYILYTVYTTVFEMYFLLYPEQSI